MGQVIWEENNDMPTCPQCDTEAKPKYLVWCDAKDCIRQGCKSCMIYDKVLKVFYCCEDCETKAFNQWIDEERARMGEETWRREEAEILTQIHRRLRAI